MLAHMARKKIDLSSPKALEEVANNIGNAWLLLVYSIPRRTLSAVSIVELEPAIALSEIVVKSVISSPQLFLRIQALFFFRNRYFVAGRNLIPEQNKTGVKPKDSNYTPKLQSDEKLNIKTCVRRSARAG